MKELIEEKLREKSTTNSTLDWEFGKATPIIFEDDFCQVAKDISSAINGKFVEREKIVELRDFIEEQIEETFKNDNMACVRAGLVICEFKIKEILGGE